MKPAFQDIKRRYVDTYIGFDSAWTDKVSAPGAICALTMEGRKSIQFYPPRLATLWPSFRVHSPGAFEWRYDLTCPRSAYNCAKCKQHEACGTRGRQRDQLAGRRCSALKQKQDRDVLRRIPHLEVFEEIRRDWSARECSYRRGRVASHWSVPSTGPTIFGTSIFRPANGSSI